MTYLKSLIVNILIVFFACYTLPGIEVMKHTKFPSVEGDLFFAIVLGGLNTLIYPILKMFTSAHYLKIAIVCVIVNFTTLAWINILPVGFKMISFGGYFWVAVVVTVFSLFTNFYIKSKPSK